MKVCSLCNAEKPFEAFGKYQRAPDGLNRVCKVCAAARAKAWRETHPEQARALVDKYRSSAKGQATNKALTKNKYAKLKTCGAQNYTCQCGATDPELFYKYKPYLCKTCTKAKAIAWREANPKDVEAYKVSYRGRAAELARQRRSGSKQ